MNAVSEYRKRRAERLAARGIKMSAVREIHMDAPDDEDNKNSGNNGHRGGGGGHGNTRLPFGLCKRFGIEIGAEWMPRDAWDALAGIGITPDGAYERLKSGGDPGAIVEPPKEPKKTYEDKGTTYSDLRISYAAWSKYSPWRLAGKADEDHTLWATFPTKADLLHALKEQGVEEIIDPETGEVLNPLEMELPKKLMKDPSGSGWFQDLALGLRKGRYAITATDMDGKKRVIADFGALATALSYLGARGVSEDAVRMSPSLKKREKERVSWLTSGKKEYFTAEDGAKYGDLSLKAAAYGAWVLTGEDESGVKSRVEFPTKTDAIKFLKEQGCEKVRMDKEILNPTEWEIPKIVATKGKRGFQEVGIKATGSGSFSFYGIDLDGREVVFRYFSSYSGQRFSEIKGDFEKELGISSDKWKIAPEDQSAIDQRVKEDEEIEQRRRAFESKAVSLKGFTRKYADLEIVSRDGEYQIIGYDENGNRQKITYADSIAYTLRQAEMLGLEPQSIIKDESIRDAYNKYQEHVSTFKQKAVSLCGGEYSDVSITYSGGDYRIVGKDIEGREKVAYIDTTAKGLADEMKRWGYGLETFPQSEAAKEHIEGAKKAEEAIKSGGYFACGASEAAYTNLHADFESGRWCVKGTDLAGAEKTLYTGGSWDDAVSKLEDWGVTSYKTKDSQTGEELSRPTYGMHGIVIARTAEGEFFVYADSKRFGDAKQMYQGISEEECRKWLKSNGVNDREVRTRGMNPNDTVVRAKPPKSLKKFDKHRLAKVDNFRTISKMTSDEKTKAADMLTELFTQGAFRMNTKGHFEERFDTHFKNLLETGRSGGSTYKEGRRETGVKTFGHEYNIKASDAEKYGYLGHEDDGEACAQLEASQYGKIVYKFKKDAIKDRVTYTFGDSLDSDRPLAGYAGSQPTIEGLSAFEWYGGVDRVREVLKSYDEYKQGKKTFSEFRLGVSNLCRDGYIECQYHGMLTMADVDTVTFPKAEFNSTFKKMTKEKRKKVLTFCKEHGMMIQYIENGIVKNGLPLIEAME